MVLASASPRRAEILEGLGIPFRVRPASVDESVHPGEAPGPHVERLARAKAEAVARHEGPDTPILAGDTIVVLGDAILGKPADDEAAVRMLLSLAGRDHHVLSALALAYRGQVHAGVSRTRVRFRAFDEEMARAYVRTGEPADKAGGYGIQGLGAVLVEEVEGDWSGVVGLPISLLVRLLDAAGLGYRFPDSLRGEAGEG